MERILVDTGFLVALGRARDPLHRASRAWLESCTARLATVTAVVVEACHFLQLESRRSLLAWLAEGDVAVIEVPPEAYPELSMTMERYRESDVNFADAALVWLANQAGHRSIVTLDEADFSRFRLKGGARFELVEWHRGRG